MAMPRILPTQRTTTIDLHWVAGFYEGEGSACCVFHRGNPRFRVSIAQVNKEPLLRLQAMFGGGLSRVRPSYVSKLRIEILYCWQWSLSGDRAAGFGMTIYSLLTNQRRQQIRKALAAWNAIPLRINECKRGHRFDYHDQVIQSKDRNGNYYTTRICFICRRASQKQYVERTKAAKATRINSSN